jgi:hypothetical protein
MKKVIIAAPNYFTSEFQVGSHHYAKAFEELGYQVAYISDPISLLHQLFAKNTSLATREQICNAGGFWEGNIWYYVPKTLISPQNKTFLSSDFIMNNWYKLTTLSLSSVLQENGFSSVDVLWFDSPLFYFLLDEVSHKHSILRLADDSRGLGTSSVHFNKEIDIGNIVDTIIYTSKVLFKTYNKIIDKSKMLYVPNGINLESFKNCNSDIPDDLCNIPEPRVIYVGAIDKWFDTDLVYASALAYPEYNFILVGKCHISIAKLLKLKNIHFLGTIPHEKVCYYLHSCSIGIIPFKQNNFIESIHPLKLYEYLACDLKVVSMKWKELKQFQKYCYLADSSSDFIKFLSSENIFNQDEIKTFLQKSSWINKLKMILDAKKIGFQT